MSMTDNYRIPKKDLSLQAIQKQQPTIPILGWVALSEQPQKKEKQHFLDTLSGFLAQAQNPLGQAIIQLFIAYSQKRKQISDARMQVIQQLCAFAKALPADLALKEATVREPFIEVIRYAKKLKTAFKPGNHPPTMRDTLQSVIELMQQKVRQEYSVFQRLNKKVNTVFSRMNRGKDWSLKAIHFRYQSAFAEPFPDRKTLVAVAKAVLQERPNASVFDQKINILCKNIFQQIQDYQIKRSHRRMGRGRPSDTRNLTLLELKKWLIDLNANAKDPNEVLKVLLQREGFYKNLMREAFKPSANRKRKSMQETLFHVVGIIQEAAQSMAVLALANNPHQNFLEVKQQLGNNLSAQELYLAEKQKWLPFLKKQIHEKDFDQKIIKLFQAEVITDKSTWDAIFSDNREQEESCLLQLMTNKEKLPDNLKEVIHQSFDTLVESALIEESSILDIVLNGDSSFAEKILNHPKFINMLGPDAVVRMLTHPEKTTLQPIIKNNQNLIQKLRVKDIFILLASNRENTKELLDSDPYLNKKIEQAKLQEKLFTSDELESLLQKWDTFSDIIVVKNREAFQWLNGKKQEMALAALVKENAALRAELEKQKQEPLILPRENRVMEANASPKAVVMEIPSPPPAPPLPVVTQTPVSSTQAAILSAIQVGVSLKPVDKTTVKEPLQGESLQSKLNEQIRAQAPKTRDFSHLEKNKKNENRSNQGIALPRSGVASLFQDPEVLRKMQQIAAANGHLDEQKNPNEPW